MSKFTPLLEGVHAAPADRPSVVTVVAAHGDLQPRGGGWAGPCPVCGGDDRFHMKDRGDGTALVGCRGCIDNEPPEVRRKAFGEVMRVLFPDRPAPARSRRNGVATRVSSEQPKSAAGLATVLGGMGCSYRYNVRSARAELHNETGGWREANDRLIAHIRATIPAEYTEAGKDRPLSFGAWHSRIAFQRSCITGKSIRSPSGWKRCRRGTRKSGSTSGCRTCSRSPTNRRSLHRGRAECCCSAQCGGRSGRQCRLAHRLASGHGAGGDLRRRSDRDRTACSLVAAQVPLLPRIATLLAGLI